MSSLVAVLIADDLTGSLDSVAPFAALGMTSVTAVTLDALGPALALAPQVLSVNLGTREMAPEQARRRSAVATRALKDAAGPGTFWIKKIDSRLKGPIAAEIAGMADVLPLTRMMLCPAIPELGRIVSDGQLRGSGVSGGIAVAKTVALDLPCEIPDATSDADLDRLAALVRPGMPVAGARGLAAALARRLQPGRLPLPALLRHGTIGFAVGSRDPVTMAQVAQLRQEGGPRIIPAPDGDVPDFPDPGPFVIQATAGAGAEGREVSARLAEGVARHIPGLTSLVLTGGETAAEVLDAMGIQLLQVEGEVLPGLPLCRALGRPQFPDLITKSGGFGPPDTLLRLWKAAQRSEGSP
jgi:D-threonate/D-erythronate kinase